MRTCLADFLSGMPSSQQKVWVSWSCVSRVIRADFLEEILFGRCMAGWGQGWELGCVLSPWSWYCWWPIVILLGAQCHPISVMTFSSQAFIKEGQKTTMGSLSLFFVFLFVCICLCFTTVFTYHKRVRKNYNFFHSRIHVKYDYCGKWEKYTD